MVEQELVRRTELRSTLVSRLWQGALTHASKDSAPSSSKSGLDSESHSAHTESSSWPVGGASAFDPGHRPACWPGDPKPACLQFGGAETQVAPAAVRVRPVRAFWGGGGDMQCCRTPPLSWEDADRQWQADEAARSAIEQELARLTRGSPHHMHKTIGDLNP